MKFIYCRKDFTKRFCLIISVVLICICFGGCSLLGDLLRDDFKLSTEATEQVTNAVSAEAVETSYSYENISNEKVKNLYLQIDSVVSGSDCKEIECTGILAEKQLFEALTAYKNDHPEVFWLKNTFTYYEYDGISYVTYEFSVTGYELAEKKEKFTAEVEKIIEMAPMYSSEYERELFVNNYLVDNCYYDEAAAVDDEVIGHENDAYGAIVEGKAVCEGYARAFQIICNRVGLDCVCIAGNADNVGHEWNCVRINGAWYQVDVTWNDSGEPACMNDYLNLTDEQMYYDHTPDKLFSEISDEDYFSSEYLLGNLFLPECDSTEYNYYEISSPLLYSFEYENNVEISEALYDAMLRGDSYFSIMVDENLDFENACYTLIDEGYIINYIDYANEMMNYQIEVDSSACSVYTKDNLRVVTMILSYV